MPKWDGEVATKIITVRFCSAWATWTKPVSVPMTSEHASIICAISVTLICGNTVAPGTFAAMATASSRSPAEPHGNTTRKPRRTSSLPTAAQCVTGHFLSSFEVA